MSRRKWPAIWIALPFASVKSLPTGVSAARKAIPLSGAPPDRVGNAQPQMPGADRLDIGGAHRREREARLGIGRAERRQPLELGDEIALRRAGRERAVDRQLGHQHRAVEPVVEPLGEELLQLDEPVGGDGETRRHRVAAAIDQQPRLARGDHRRAERETGDRAAGAPADAVGQRDDAGRPLVALPEPAATMPMTPGCQPSAAAKTSTGESLFWRSTSSIAASKRRALDLAALLVVAVEMLRPFGGERRVVGRQQPRAEIGGADPAAGIDPRPQHEAELIGVDRLDAPGRGAERRQRGHAGIAAALPPP